MPDFTATEPASHAANASSAEPDQAPDHSARRSLEAALEARFAELLPVPADLSNAERLGPLVFHAVCRRYSDRPVSAELKRLLCACALASPSKSDLQQRDVVDVTRLDLRERISSLMPHMPWVREAPAFLVFCANGRRLPSIAVLRGKPFPNHHLDLFFNAVTDAAMALSACVFAVNALGLGCCPISEIRNHAPEISAWLKLPDRVIPVAGLCIGWPIAERAITPRLPLSLTVHENRFDEGDLSSAMAAYDARRADVKSSEKQRHAEQWGLAPDYGWSEDKARQYAQPLRADFGRFVRSRGFSLE